MRILALDPGIKTGWAAMDGDKNPVSGVEIFKILPEDSPGVRFLMFRRWIAQQLVWLSPELVAYEKAFVMPRGATTALFFGLIAEIQAACAERKVKHVAVNAISLKKYATGYGRATKASMLDSVCARWKALQHSQQECSKICTDPVHDEADALACLHYAAEHYGEGR